MLVAEPQIRVYDAKAGAVLATGNLTSTSSSSYSPYVLPPCFDA